MCSIGEEDFGDEGGAHTMVADPKITPIAAAVLDEICKKCNERKVVIKLNYKDAQCEPCFFQYARHKLRASMGSTKIIERGARVLLVFDGSIESCVMFDIIRHSVSMEQFKRLTIKPCAVYVDATCISGLSIDKRHEHITETGKVLQHFGFESYYASIANDVQTMKFESFQLDDEQLSKEQKFITMFNAIGNQTAKEDFLNIRNMNVYREVASNVDCKYVFLSTISHQVAATLLVNVALGRGKSVANDISFADNRQNCAAQIIRPMRNVNSLEVETYVRLDKELNQLIQNSDYFDIFKMKSVTSIQSLTLQFIDNLQENFASTVSTMFRTGDKISAAASTHHHDQPKETCKFCHSDLDYQNSATLFAIEYSRCMSASADQNELNDVDRMLKKAENQVLGQNDDNVDDTNSLIKSLCHGCRNIFRDLDEPNTYIQ